MLNKRQYYSFIDNFDKLIKKHFIFNLDDYIQKSFKMFINDWDITLILKPKIIKRKENYNMSLKNNKEFNIELISSEQIKAKNSLSLNISKDFYINNNKENKIKKENTNNNNDILEKKIISNYKCLNDKFFNQRKESKNKSYRNKSVKNSFLIFPTKKENEVIGNKKIINNNSINLIQINLIEKKNNNEIKPKGLSNFSSNKYTNSLLQCLFYIKELREYFICNQNKFTDKQPICKALAEVMNGLKNSNNNYFEAKQFEKIMEKENNLLFGNKEANIKELFINLINSIFEELNEEKNNEELEDFDLDFSNKIKIFKKAFKKIDQNNIINKIFTGYYNIKYRCQINKVNIYSFQTESFIRFELEKIKKYFNNNNKLSLELCFKYYYRKQDTDFYCNKCETVHKGNAYERIYRPPKILLIILDRSNDETFKEKVEINKYLDFRKIIFEEKYEYNSLYKLICITHKDNYAACCLTDNGKYYCFNDKNIDVIDEKNLRNDEPYLLFYEQIDMNKEDKNEIEKIKKEAKIIQINESGSSLISTRNHNNNYLTLQTEHKLLPRFENKSIRKKSISPINLTEVKKIKNEIKPKGLLNFSLNKYFNSLLQCLFYVKDLREYFIYYQNKFTNEQPVCKAFAEIMNGLKNSNNNYFEVKEFKKMMEEQNNIFYSLKQKDMKELLIHLIDSLINELNPKNNNIEKFQSKEIDYTNKNDVFNEELKEVDLNNIVKKLFIGYYETVYKCQRNYNVKIYSFQSESFIIFELEKIKNYFNNNYNKLSLELCFKYYYREQLNSEFYCNKCKAVHKGNAYEKIYRPPKILLIILDRGNDETFKEKIEINKYLDLKNIIDEKEYKYNSLYKLICVSTKHLSLLNNPYIAYCLTDNGKYYYFSDKYVNEIKEKNIMNDEHYLLFYEQIDMNKEDKNEIEKIKKETKIIQINEKRQHYSNSRNHFIGRDKKGTEYRTFDIFYSNNTYNNHNRKISNLNNL